MPVSWLRHDKGMVKAQLKSIRLRLMWLRSVVEEHG
jgi:hypothetical protein